MRLHLTLYAVILLAAPRAEAQVSYAPIATGKVRGQPYEAYRVMDSLGRSVEFFVSETASTASLPLIVYVHGSGHASHFQRLNGRVTPANGHATLVDVARARARIVVVEKPGVQRYDRDDVTPARTFQEEHTLDRWAEAVAAATIAARRLPDVDSTRVLLLGHSEGGLVAARVAARLPTVTHVALLAGGGPSQLFDLLALAGSGAFFADVSPDPQTRRSYVLAYWDSILAAPTSVDRTFFGHAYRRWASFLSDSPIRELGRTTAKVFIGQGSADRVVTREAFDVLAADLISAGRHPRVVLVPEADHSFLVAAAGKPAEDKWRDILTTVIAWFLLNGDGG